MWGFTPLSHPLRQPHPTGIWLLFRYSRKWLLRFSGELLNGFYFPVRPAISCPLSNVTWGTPAARLSLGGRLRGPLPRAELGRAVGAGPPGTAVGDRFRT